MSETGKRHPPRPSTTSNELVVSARCRGDINTLVSAVAPAATPTGEGYIALRYGRTLLYLEDRAALVALDEAVRRALGHADLVYGPVEDAFTTTERHSRTYWEHAGSRQGASV